MKKKNLKWRLSKLPTPSDVVQLVNSELITQEEAKEILFDKVDKGDVESLKQEIKFLRQLVDKLSDKPAVIETIRTIKKPYYNWSWYKPYEVWCSTSTVTDDIVTYTNPTSGSYSNNSEIGSGIFTSADNSICSVSTFN